MNKHACIGGRGGFSEEKSVRIHVLEMLKQSYHSMTAQLTFVFLTLIIVFLGPNCQI